MARHGIQPPTIHDPPLTLIANESSAIEKGLGINKGGWKFPVSFNREVRGTNFLNRFSKVFFKIPPDA